MAGEERCHASCLTDVIVRGELGIRQEPGPVVLGVVNIGTEVIFQALYSILRLAVSLRVVGGGQFNRNMVASAVSALEMAYKGAPTVQDN
jgi:hypothetical protein